MLPSAQEKGGLRNDREVGNVGHCDLGMMKEEDLVGASSRDSGGEKRELTLTPPLRSSAVKGSERSSASGGRAARAGSSGWEEITVTLQDTFWRTHLDSVMGTVPRAQAKRRWEPSPGLSDSTLSWPPVFFRKLPMNL